MIFFLLYNDLYIQIRPLPTEKIQSCEFAIFYFLHFLQQSARQHWKCMATIFIWDRRLNKNQKRISTQSTWQLNMILNIGSARFLFWEKEKGFRNIKCYDHNLIKSPWTLSQGSAVINTSLDSPSCSVSVWFQKPWKNRMVAVWLNSRIFLIWKSHGIAAMKDLIWKQLGNQLKKQSNMLSTKKTVPKLVPEEVTVVLIWKELILQRPSFKLRDIWLTYRLNSANLSFESAI